MDVSSKVGDASLHCWKHCPREMENPEEKVFCAGIEPTTLAQLRVHRVFLQKNFPAKFHICEMCENQMGNFHFQVAL